MRNIVIIYPSQHRADEAFRRTFVVFDQASFSKVDHIRRKLTLRKGGSIRFISENKLCHKLDTLRHETDAIVDCWTWDEKLDEFELEMEGETDG